MGGLFVNEHLLICKLIRNSEGDFDWHWDPNINFSSTSNKTTFSK